jgi:hypothetical protein
MRKLAVAVAAAAAAASALTACGSGGGSGTQVVQGQVLGGTQLAAIYSQAMDHATGICGGAIDGTQVMIKGPSGTLLATTTLHEDAKATSALNLPASMSSGPLANGQIGVYDFAATIPAGSGPYTIEVVGVSSLVVSASQLHHLQMTC